MNSINDNYSTNIVSFQAGIRSITNNWVISRTVRGRFLPMGNLNNYN